MNCLSARVAGNIRSYVPLMLLALTLSPCFLDVCVASSAFGSRRL
jgi:hypothetical protein